MGDEAGRGPESKLWSDGMGRAESKKTLGRKLSCFLPEPPSASGLGRAIEKLSRIPGKHCRGSVGDETGSGLESH